MNLQSKKKLLRVQKTTREREWIPEQSMEAQVEGTQAQEKKVASTPTSWTPSTHNPYTRQWWRRQRDLQACRGYVLCDGWLRCGWTGQCKGKYQCKNLWGKTYFCGGDRQAFIFSGDKKCILLDLFIGTVSLNLHYILISIGVFLCNPWIERYSFTIGYAVLEVMR